MTDETTPNGDQSTTFTQEQVAAQIAQAVEEATAGLKTKNAELLGETKAEREKRTALETAQAEAEAERQKEKGEFKALYEKTQADLAAEREANATFRGTIAKRDIDAEAASIGSELTRDTAKAAILREQAAKYAKNGDSGVTYEIGGVAVDRAKVVEHLTAQFPFLVDGSQSTGGGASGGSGGAASDLSKMGDKERLELARQGKLRPK